jgi:uncharacterized protein (TIGR02246 family)
MFRSLAIVMMCGLLMSCASTQPATGAAEAEVQQASDRFWATRERGDASALASLFTDTAIYGVPGLPDATGRDAIRELLQKRFASGRTTDFKVQRREIHVAGDTAHELGWFSEVSHHGQGDAMRMEGRYLIVWTRGSDDAWRVHRHFYAFSGAKPVAPR